MQHPKPQLFNGGGDIAQLLNLTTYFGKAQHKYFDKAQHKYFDKAQHKYFDKAQHKYFDKAQHKYFDKAQHKYFDFVQYRNLHATCSDATRGHLTDSSCPVDKIQVDSISHVENAGSNNKFGGRHSAW